MASLLRRPFDRARAIVAATAVVGTADPRPWTSTPKPPSSPARTSTSTTMTARLPSWLCSPLRRLRWLRARIRAERHDRVSQFGSSAFRPDPAGARPRSFREILGRKLVEAEVDAPRGARALPLAELLERVAENLFLMCWWEAEWLFYALARWAFGALVPDRWQWLAATPWWWGDAVCAWWAEVLVARAGDGGKGPRHPSLRKVRMFVCHGDAVICEAACRGPPDRWGVVPGRLDDLVELTRLLCEISWCFVCFYFWASTVRVLSYPRRVIRFACKALGVDAQRCRLDIELLEL
ncbi:hypothetical protein F5X99DRAFT_382342, partial [Biscogniauxia marginata]